MVTEALYVGGEGTAARLRAALLPHGWRLATATPAEVAARIGRRMPPIIVDMSHEAEAGALLGAFPAGPGAPAAPLVAIAPAGSEGWRRANSHASVHQVVDMRADPADIARAFHGAAACWAIRSEAADLSQFVDLSADVLCTLDEDGAIVAAPSGWDALGYEPAQVAGVRLLEVVHDGDRQEAARVCRIDVEPVHDVTVRVGTPAGEERWLSWSARTVGDRRYCLARDVTRVVQAEQRAQQTLAQLSQYVDLSGEVLCALDGDGRIRVAPSGWKSVLGFASADVVGTAFVDYIHPEDRVVAQAITDLANPEVRDMEVRFLAADGSARWLSWAARTVGESRYCISRDVSRLVEAEAKLQKALAQIFTKKREVEQQSRVVEALRAEAEFQASHDQLTGLHNRRAWFELVQQAEAVAVAVFDIDHFKRINDTYGHPEGDVVLKEVASRLNAVIDGYGLVARLGGEEFAAYFLESDDVAARVAEEAVAVVAATPVGLSDGTEVPVTISGGLAPWIAGDDSVRDTYEAADAALYAAKEGGRARLIRAGERRAA